MNKSRLVKLSSTITHLAGYGNYTYIYFLDAPRQLYARTLGSFAQDLPQFVRIHKSYLVNPDYVKHYEINQARGANLQVDTQQLPISKRRLPAIKRIFESKVSWKAVKSRLRPVKERGENLVYQMR